MISCLQADKKSAKAHSGRAAPLAHDHKTPENLRLEAYTTIKILKYSIQSVGSPDMSIRTFRLTAN